MTDPLGLINNTGAAGGGLTPQRATGAGDGPSFKDVLMKNIEEVNQLQQDAARAIEDLSSGKSDDVFGAMNAQRKSEMAFQMLLQVRNRMLDAYEEIKQMRV
ncbi:MAG: flagellar hook-basal body complex protein FliE [Planctomycetes bacterium]|nr:flagellar hook-basal body complex protein FliE [Planctomycetota bacterium]